MSIGLIIGMNANNFSRRIRSAALAAALTLGVAAGSAHADTSTPEQLLASCGIDTSRVRVASAEGIVIVKGKVPDRESIRQATEILRSAGYARVANLLVVSSRPDDEVLQRNVERQLLRTRSLDGCHFRVITRAGVVTLQGTVRQDLQKDVATDLVKNVDGVREVVNSLERTPSQLIGR